MRRTALLLPLAATLVAVPLAAAKGAFLLCGADRCTALDVGALPAGLVGAAPGATRVPVARPAPYYAIRFAGADGDVAYWVPSAHALRFSVPRVAWVATTSGEQALLERVAAEVTAFAAPADVRAAVGGVAVANPRGYFSLLWVGRRVQERVGGTWLQVYLYAPRAGPWTDGRDELWISRRGPYLQRDGALLRIPRALARRIRARRPLS